MSELEGGLILDIDFYAAEFFPDRSEVQCLHRWQKVLNPDIVKGPWTKEVDTSLFTLVTGFEIVSETFFFLRIHFET